MPVEFAPRSNPESPNAPKYAVSISLDFAGPGGNAFAILGQVRRALFVAGASEEECKAFYDEATSGDYDNLLAVVRKWVHVVD